MRAVALAAALLLTWLTVMALDRPVPGAVSVRELVQGEPIRPPVVELYLRPVAVATATATATPMPTVTPTPEPARETSDRSGRRLWVRLTYYVDRGLMRTGPWTFPGAAAVDPTCIPHGTVFRVVGDDVLRVALDSGFLVRGCHADLWFASDREGRDFIREHGERAEIEVLQEVE